jgi:hypothetical protein
LSKHIENSVRILFCEIIAWGIDEYDSSAVWELFFVCVDGLCACGEEMANPDVLPCSMSNKLVVDCVTAVVIQE